MLTEKQYQAYEFIKTYIKQNNIAPTGAEIAFGIGIKSRGVVHRYLTALCDAGFIRLLPNRRRNIELVRQEDHQQLPILGKIAAGSPIEAISSPTALDLTDQFAGKDCFVLQVKGNSMIGDNICDGDYIICEKVGELGKNDIAIVLIDGSDATLKRLHYNSDNTVTLIPSNPTLSPIVYQAEQISIQGRYVGLVRSLV